MRLFMFDSNFLLVIFENSKKTNLQSRFRRFLPCFTLLIFNVSIYNNNSGRKDHYRFIYYYLFLSSIIRKNVSLLSYFYFNTFVHNLTFLICHAASYHADFWRLCMKTHEDGHFVEHRYLLWTSLKLAVFLCHPVKYLFNSR